MVGIPDGLGMLGQGANLVLYMNQELRGRQGIARRHGLTGAFVSRWVIDPATLAIKEGSDFINPGVQYWDYPTGTYVTYAGARFADGALQELTFGGSAPGRCPIRMSSTTVHEERMEEAQIYFGDKKLGDISRTFGITKEGDATALPRLGLFRGARSRPPTRPTRPWSSVRRTTTPSDVSQLWVYVGTRPKSRPADRQGRPDERRRSRP